MRKVFPLMVLTLVGMCLGVGCGTINNAVTVPVSDSSSQNTGTVYFMAGKIEAGETAYISSRITAKVLSVRGNVGAAVKKGDQLIIMDTKDLAALAAQANAGVSSAQAAVDGVQTNYASAHNTHSRNQVLYDAGAISKSQLEQSQAQVSAMQSALNVSQAQLNQAQAALESAAAQLGNGTIVSPLSGIITAKSINTGELATVGAPLLTIVNLDYLTVKAFLPADLISRIRVGHEVVIKVSEIPEKEFQGRISMIYSVVDGESSNVEVKVEFINQDPLLKPGMFAEIGWQN